MWLDWIRANPTAILVIADIILSIFQYKRTGKISFLNFKDTSASVDSPVTDDLKKLKEYHEKMALEIGKKITK